MWGQKKPLRKAKTTRIAWTSRPKADEVPPKKRDLRAAWKDPETEAMARNRVEPAHYQPLPVASPELEANLVPGGSVVATRDLCLGERGVYPYPALVIFYGSPDASVPVPKGSLLMYAGELRSTERRSVRVNGEYRYVNVQVTKHTFITPHGRCIIHDFNLIRPV